jgi:NAD dependent epimerase/dehydratase family enzyme
VRRLTTGKKSGEDDFSWDPKAGTIDAEAFEGADAVIHLAGENIASGSFDGPFNVLGR